MKQKLNEKGFTLVELLVVIAIIGILAAIVLVSLNSARDRAREASLQSTMASITTLGSLCINDGGTVQAPTSGTAGGGEICSDSDITPEIWPDLSNVQGLESAGYQYMDGAADGDTDSTLTAGDGTDAVVTCNVSTGSCSLN